jgi:two-component system nitrogen regulation sensor histidine kinase NtrY
MKLKSKFILFCVVLHLTFIFLLKNLPEDKLYIFVIGEILILISLILSIWLYRGISQPANLISAGIESIKDKDFNTRMIKVGHEEMDDLITVYNQMMDQLREERIKHTEKEQVLDKLIDASPSGIVMLNAENRISSINSSARTMLKLGEENVTGLSLNEIEGRLAEELTLLNDGEALLVTLNGSEVYKCQKAHFVNLGYSHYFIMIETLSSEIYKKEKHAFEKVIRIMSHETNNSIGAINSILGAVLNFKGQLDPTDQDDYENVLSVAINRNKSLSNIMSNFAEVVKIPQPVKEQADVHRLLKSVQMLMNAEGLKKQIKWKLDLAEQPFNAYVDVQQMEQVLINVIKNAIEASKPEGTIVLRSSLNPSTISIMDNGTGITKEVGQGLFTPFFSTKKNGQGIGLTLTREILFNHQFQYSLETTKGWTLFKIFLPVLE